MSEDDLQVTIDDPVIGLDLSKSARAIDRSEKPKKKRGPGRPRKEEVEPEPEPEEEEEGPEDEVDDDRTELNRLRNIALELKKRLHVTGSGRDLGASNWSVPDMKAEVDLMNSQINSRRGDEGSKLFFTELVAPALMKLIDNFVPDKETLDVTTKFQLNDEIKNNWAIFDDAVTQIAINHSAWFSVNPYMAVVKSTGQCIKSCNEKNQKAKHYTPPDQAPAPSPTTKVLS